MRYENGGEKSKMVNTDIYRLQVRKKGCIDETLIRIGCVAIVGDIIYTLGIRSPLSLSSHSVVYDVSVFRHCVALY